MKEILTAQDAAKILQANSQSVREHLKMRVPPFDRCGTVLKKGGKRRQYLVYTRKLLEAFGIPEDVAEKRLSHGENHEDHDRDLYNPSDMVGGKLH